MVRVLRGWSAGLLAFAVSGAPLQARAWDIPPPVKVQPLEAGVQVRSVALTRMAVRIRPGTPWLAVKGGLVCWPVGTKRWEGGEEEAAAADTTHKAEFNEELAKAGFKTAGDTTSLFAESTDAAAEFQIGAEIVDMREELCYRVNELTAEGKAAMTVAWEIYSTFDKKVVARVTTTGGYKIGLSSGPALLLYQGAALENLRALINSSEFRNAVKGPSRAPGELTTPASREPIALKSSASYLSVADAVGSVTAVFAGSGFGSGFIVGDGYILTNHHVVSDAKTVRIKWSDGLEGTGEVERTDARRDVALVKTDTRGRPSLLISQDAVRPGDAVFAVGTPLNPELQGTVTKGVVSALRTFDGFSYIQSDVTVNHGNSGGPLLDEKGRVVGMTVAGYEPNGAPTGINLFIPIRDAVDFLSLKLQASN